MKQPLSIVKIGGNVLENSTELTRCLRHFAQLKEQKILIHGGGNKATELAEKLGLQAKMVGGRRITDSRNLDVAVMVYGGLLNKSIVALLQSNSCNAMGISGADGNTILAHKRPVGEIDYGFAGDIDHVNGQMVSRLLEAGVTPVFCALTHNGKGQLLNTNADTIASELAIAMSHDFETTLYYCFDKKGVLQDINDEVSVISHIDKKVYKDLRNNGIISEGMLPKLENCFHALHKKVGKVCIGDIDMLRTGAKLFTTITL